MIQFHTEDIRFTLKEKTRLKRWITAVIQQKKREVGEINFVFCSDKHLLGMNQQYLNHHTLTDIITFDYSKDNPEMPISGDIFISVERTRENAEKFAKTSENELHRVMIHGVLHLLGFKDKTPVAKAEMTKQEDRSLKLLEAC